MVTPYFSVDGITIYHGDCRDILPALEPDTADLIVTDPPYGVRYVSKASQRPARPIVGDDSLDSMADAMPLLHGLLRNDRHAYFFASAARIGDAGAIVSDYFRLKNVLVWDKGNAGSRGDCVAGYGVNWEGILYANKGRRALNGPRPRAIYRYDWQSSRDPAHPTSKPVTLLSWLLFKSSMPGELVIDPFMGSGPTLKAAQDMGRRAIGIEIEERYCEAAVRRLQEGGGE